MLVYGGSILVSFAMATATCCASHGPSVPPGLLPDAVSFLVAHRPCPLALGWGCVGCVGRGGFGRDSRLL